MEQMQAALNGEWTGSLEVRNQMIFDLIGAAQDDLFSLTGSGAEAICQVHWTAFTEIARKEGKSHFITSPFEDAPTMQSLKRLEELGCFVKIAPVDASGRIDVEKLAEMIGPRTAMISVSWAQGLTGVVQPIEEIAALAKAKNVLLHVDGTYAVGKVYLNFSQSGIDYLTFSGDRIHSIPSSGAVFAKKGRSLTSLVLARPDDVASLLSFSAACAQAALSLDAMSLEVARLRDQLEQSIVAAIPGAQIVQADSLRLPNVTAIQFPAIHNEMLHYSLHRKGISAAIGGTYQPKIHRVLIASGAEEIRSQTAVSFALSRYTTEADIDRAVKIIIETVAELRPLAEEIFS